MGTGSQSLFALWSALASFLDIFVVSSVARNEGIDPWVLNGESGGMEEGKYWVSEGPLFITKHL